MPVGGVGWITAPAPPSADAPPVDRITSKPPGAGHKKRGALAPLVAIHALGVSRVKARRPISVHHPSTTTASLNGGCIAYSRQQRRYIARTPSVASSRGCMIVMRDTLNWRQGKHGSACSHLGCWCHTRPHSRPSTPSASAQSDGQERMAGASSCSNPITICLGVGCVAGIGWL
jgi:hypothetical protein